MSRHSYGTFGVRPVGPIRWWAIVHVEFWCKDSGTCWIMSHHSCGTFWVRPVGPTDYESPFMWNHWGKASGTYQTMSYHSCETFRVNYRGSYSTSLRAKHPRSRAELFGYTGGGGGGGRGPITPWPTIHVELGPIRLAYDPPSRHVQWDLSDCQPPFLWNLKATIRVELFGCIHWGPVRLACDPPSRYVQWDVSD